ncbi:uncharacterized protein EDB91DRAFT_1087521 [Suillus paluster]|uniref:uncharacterized protein n=1 Tax=Suillus paluster TaxID=48578 RepID=UPI001B87BFC5|nr:uncharacterized protein EDB91DRAFT_1087521 [Suillus paluster]KAG1724293.1 hypothetical protein EDB91DRAFT_1087521 [Suillus paluster]
MAGMEPTPSKIEDPSVIEGLIFEPSQVQLAPDPSPTPPTARDIVVLDDPCNLFLEYDSADDMDVEVKVEVEGGDEAYPKNEIIEFWVTFIDIRVTNIEFQVFCKLNKSPSTKY